MRIELPEETNIRNIKKLYMTLIKYIDTEPVVILDLKKMKRIDLSLAQLIMAANRISKKNGRKFILKSVSKNIMKQFYLAGFAK